MGRYRVLDPTAALTDRMIMDQIERDSRVIDLGCGDGRLLCRLRDELGCSVQGVELDLREVVSAISKGMPVIQADLDHRLIEIPERSFDYAVLSQTLQQVRHPKELLTEMLRIAKQVIILVPNYGHWWIRLQILLHGRTPVTSSLPYDWYNTPNLHFLSMIDFRELCEQMQFKIVKEIPIVRGQAAVGAWAANLRADNALYVLEHV
jgi:methionine biosynthesis protein MetW